MDCKATWKIWIQDPFTVAGFNVQSQDIFNSVQEMSSKLTKVYLELKGAISWVVWHSRNKFIFEGKKIHPRISATKAESIMEAYQRVRKTQSSHIDNSRIEKQLKWIPPPENVFKINVDAAISSKDQMAGMGAIIRDSNSRVVAAGIKQAQHRRNVSFAEAEAVQCGMQVAREAGLTSLIIEIECLEVVELLNNTKGSRTEMF